MQFILRAAEELQLLPLINLIVLGHPLIESPMILVWSISDDFLFFWTQHFDCFWLKLSQSCERYLLEEWMLGFPKCGIPFSLTGLAARGSKISIAEYAVLREGWANEGAEVAYR